MNETLHVYTRVSTTTQQEEGTSLESQRELGIKKAESLGFDYKIWNEGGASSRYEDFANRPVLLKLLSQIDTGNVKHLWVYNNDRLSRNPTTANTIKLKLQKNSVLLYTNNVQFDLNNHIDDFLKTILDGVAQLDNAQRAERTRLGKLNRVKSGGWMGGPPPYGYKVQDKKLVINEKESVWVKKIYSWYSERKSVEWIKSELDRSGVQTRRKKSLWSLGSIRKILQNTHPIGYYNFTDTKIEETIKCKCSPIVSTSLWNKCQERRKEIYARKGQRNRTQRFYMLRDLLYCGHCGSHMSGRIKESKNEYLYYCPRREREWVKAAPKGEDKWKRGQGCTMNRSLNIHATDKLLINNVSSEVFMKIIQSSMKNYLDYQEENQRTDEDIKIQKKKLDIQKKRFEKELEQAIKDTAIIETEKLQGLKDADVANEIIKNMNDFINDTREKIEQVKIEINVLSNDYNFLDRTRAFSFGRSNKCLYKPFEDKHKNKRNLEEIIRRIDVYYDADRSEHRLVVNMKVPIIGEVKELHLKSKKKPQKNENTCEPRYPTTTQSSHGGIVL